MSQPPLRLRFEDEARTKLAADWRDGHVSVYPLAYLRGWCPCATCQGHGSTRSFVPATANEIVSMKHVGSYAVSFEWNDGHSTGIYTWDSLREMCPCEPCGSGRAGTPANILQSSPAS